MAPTSSERQTIHPKPGGSRHGKGMVPGVKIGGLLFFSAVRGGDADRNMSHDTREQTVQAFKNLRLMLEGEGASLDNVAKVTVYFQDLAYRAAFHEVWMEVFPENPPARSAMQVANASANQNGYAHFMMDVIAVAPE